MEKTWIVQNECCFFHYAYKIKILTSTDYLNESCFREAEVSVSTPREIDLYVRKTKYEE